MSEQDVIDALLQLKEQALDASARNDRAFYDSYLHPDAVAILPVGRLGKAQVLASMTGDKAPFSAKRVENTAVQVLGPDAAVVTYDAIYDRGGHEVTVVATTVYKRERDGWKGILYQQTPRASG